MVRGVSGVRAGIDTPTGPVWAEVSGDAVTAVGWGDAPRVADDPVLQRALTQLTEYFEGDLNVFDLPLAPQVQGLTAQVLTEMLAIPFGETRTYGDLAKALGAPPQAIGQACGANPIPIIIPCHRVLAANGLGGFSGAGGIETKVALLKLEGAASLLI